MAGHTFFGKQKLCYTEVSDFTDYQGIGHDPMYKRYDSVFSVVKRAVPSDLHHFLATPEYLDDEDQICWHVDNWNECPSRLTELSGAEYDRYKSILEDTVRKYKSSIMNLNGEDLQIMAGAIKYIDDDRVYCGDGKVYLVAWGMTPDVRQHKVVGSVIHDFEYVKKYKISFDAGEHGTLSKLDKSMNRAEGATLSSADLPELTVMEGWNFIGWEPSPLGHVVTSDMSFTAKYEKAATPVTPPVPPVPPIPPVPPVPPTPDYFNCRFDAGEHGKINGASNVRKEANTRLANGEIPGVTPNKGYKFKGWNVSPHNMLVDGDKVFTAQYEEIIPWYRRWWLWLTGLFAGLFAGKGCLKWLLWLLLGILLCWILSWLLNSCGGRHGRTILPDDRVDRIEHVTNPDGTIHDNNGSIGSIIGDDGRLPEDGVVSPIVGEDGTIPPIVSNPGTPDVIDNRLNIYFEDENADLNKWAQDFKRIYPSDDYQITGYDPNVKMIQIQIPAGRRNQVREELPSKITDQEFFVVDESIMTLHGHESQANDNAPKGWHLKATHVKEAWTITKGDPNVVVAIIDDGIDVNHKMFSGRFYKAYNVFTQNRALSPGQGHGTHVAGLAVGSADFFNEGAAGVAPNCKIMPVQVFDNGMCTFSSLASGIMYAIHNGADVVNISVGPSFPGLDQLPVDEQILVANQYFKNEERVYKHIIKTAKEKNVVLVFAAGNDNIVTAILPECRSVTNSVNVAACTSEYKSSDFTNYLLGTNVSAPGVNIYSAYPTNSFKMFDGTSMAAPIISGTIALMKTYKKDITAKQAIAVIQSTGRDLDKFIPPMVLIDKAVLAVKNGNIPSEPVWTQRIEQGTIEHIGTDPSAGAVAEPPTSGSQTTDDYSSLRNLLKQLKEQRDALNQKINEIEQKLK